MHEFTRMVDPRSLIHLRPAVAVSLALGLAAAWILTRLMARLLYGISAKSSMSSHAFEIIERWKPPAGYFQETPNGI